MIIVSTVRSSRNWIDYDLRHTLGFVANPRRFNGAPNPDVLYIYLIIFDTVAVTRAQALLIVIGDPNVLSLDPLWRSFLNYVDVNGGWRGPPPSWDTSAPVNQDGAYAEGVRASGLADMNDFTRRMETLTLAGVGDEDLDAADSANIDRPWRVLE